MSRPPKPLSYYLCLLSREANKHVAISSAGCNRWRAPSHVAKRGAVAVACIHTLNGALTAILRERCPKIASPKVGRDRHPGSVLAAVAADRLAVEGEVFAVGNGGVGGAAEVEGALGVGGDVANAHGVGFGIGRAGEAELGGDKLAGKRIHSAVVGNVSRAAVVEAAVGVDLGEEGAIGAELFAFGHGLAAPAENSGGSCAFAADVKVAILAEGDAIQAGVGDVLLDGFGGVAKQAPLLLAAKVKRFELSDLDGVAFAL